MIIYKAINKINGKCYIGQTSQLLESRKWSHINNSKIGLKTHFYNALRKYGLDVFEWKIIEECDSTYDLNLAEEWYIRYFNSYYNGYNSTFGGKANRGRISPKKGKTYEQMYGVKKAKEMKEYHNKKVSETLKGRLWGDYWNKEEIIKYKKSLSDRMKIFNPMFDVDVAKDHSNKMMRKYLIVKPDGSEDIITKCCMCQLANGKLKYYRGYKCTKLN